MARLRGQIVFARLDRALQAALNGRDVVDRFGHHAGQFLHARETVEFERVEVLLGILRQSQPRLHLRFGLQLNVAQLSAQTLEVPRQFAERVAQLTHLGFQPGPRTHEFAGLCRQAIQQLAANPNGLSGGDARRHQGQRRGQGDAAQHRRRSSRDFTWPHRFTRGRLGSLCDRRRLVNDRSDARGGGADILALRTNGTDLQPLECELKLIKVIEQRLDITRLDAIDADGLYCGFCAVSHLPQAQRPCQTRTALEGVQRSQNLTARAPLLRVGYPLAHRSAELRQQLFRLFLEDGEKVGVNGIGNVDVIGNACGRSVRRRHVCRCGTGLGGGNRRGKLGCCSGLCRLGRPVRLGFAHGRFQRLHSPKDVRAGRLQDARCKLVEDTPNVLGSLIEHACLFDCAVGLPVQALHRMLYGARQFRKRSKADGGRAACQRVGTRDGTLWDRLIELKRPFGKLSDQLSRPLIRLVEIDVVQRRADAQVADLLVRVVRFAFR